MAHPGKTPFEIIRGEGDAQDRLRVPNWWRSPNGRQASTEPRAEKANWFMQPVTLRLNRAMLLGLAAVLGAALVLAYELGAAGREPPASADERSSAAVADLRRQTPNSLLMVPEPTSSSRNGEAARPSVVERRPNANPSDGVVVADAGSPADPREPGYNYFCLATMPPKYRAEAEKAVRFLRDNRVDAAVISVDNRWLQVIAVKGFEKASSDEARDYERLLRALGKAWKAEHRGWSDWHDLYAIKYQP